MQFLLLHQSALKHDAIGQDMLEMFRVLEPWYSCHLFCEYCDVLEEIPRVDAAGAAALLADASCVAIYHHSIHWQLGEDLLGAAAGSIVFKYHNVTPPNFFADVPGYWEACVAGREQTYRFLRRFPKAFWLADSLFNLRELQFDMGVRHAVVPPFLGANDGNGLEPDEDRLRALLGDRKIHALSVGRFVPNKGHLFLLDVADWYRERHGDDLVLHIVGKRDQAFAPYCESILAKISELHLNKMVEIVGEVTPSQLLAYYLGCDAYICCSEHEGFCVPIVESQSLGLPVVARALSAVPETIGPGQILLGDKPAAYADSLRRLRMDEAYRNAVSEGGRRNYLERFTREKIQKSFLGALRGFGVLG